MFVQRLHSVKSEPDDEPVRSLIGWEWFCDMGLNQSAESIETLLVVNAGGASRRMGGRTKALLPVPPDDRPLIQVILTRLATLAPSSVLVITRDEAVEAAVRSASAGSRTEATVIGDRADGLGPLGGLWSALEWAHGRSWRGWLLFVACDMPYLTPATLRVLLDHAASSDQIVIPVTGGRYQPLHALYHTDCLPAVRAAVSAQRLKLTSFHADVRVKAVDEADLRAVDPTLRALINVNTPDEWRRVRCELQIAAGEDARR